MTRAGVVAAAKDPTLEIDFKGLSPNQTFSGDPNDYIVRESYMYDVDLSRFTPGGTVSDEDAGTGFTLLDGPFVSDTAADYDFQGPAWCLQADALAHETSVVEPWWGRAIGPTPGHSQIQSYGGQVLELANVEVVYNEVILVLRGLSIQVPDGQIVALLGANGAGKTTTLRAVTGLLDVHNGTITKGSVTYDGVTLNGKKPSEIVSTGITQVMEGRRVFGELTVDENLICGGISVKDKSATERGVRAGDGVVPAAQGTPQAGGRLPVGRRAADARHRPGADVGAPAAGARRTLARTRPQARRADPRHHRRHQQVRHQRAADRAERDHGALDRQLRLHHGDRQDRHGRRPARSSSPTTT